jgi:hypothetical protein
MVRSRKQLTRIGSIAVLVALTLAAASGVALAGQRSCTTAWIAEPFILPDGSEHPAGELTLCIQQRHSPVAFLHETRVDGNPVGLLISRHTTTYGGDLASSFVVFDRLSDGRLNLLGYASAKRDRVEIFAMSQPRVRTTHSLEKLARILDAPGDDSILIAAHGR